MRPRGGDGRRVASLREGRLGVLAGDGVEARPQCGDLVALAVRREAQSGGEGVLDEGVLLHGRPDHAGRHLDGGHEVWRSGEHVVGRVVLVVALDTPVALPRPRLGADDDDRVKAAIRHRGQRVVDDLLLGDADLAQDGAGPGRAYPPGHRPRRVGERPAALGHGDAVDACQEARPTAAEGVGRGRRHGGGHEVHHGRRLARGAEPDQNGQARVERAHTTADATVPPWPTAKRAGGRPN